jgi:large subunit ribosomal protein L24
MKIHKGDRVRVITGKDKGKEGTVDHAMPREGKVIIEGVNIVKKHQRKQRQTMQAGIIEKAMPLEVSNVMLLSPSDGKPTRVGYRFTPDGEKVRICKRTGAISMPETKKGKGATAVAELPAPTPRLKQLYDEKLRASSRRASGSPTSCRCRASRRSW